MKTRFGVLAILLLAQFSFAQDNLDEELNAELDKMYSSSKQAPQVQVNVQQEQGQLQTQLQSPLAVQKQPTTVIEASPLTESRAEKLRKARQNAELLTEQRIVEKLETSRMEDEQKRSAVLFDEKFNNMGQPTPTPAAIAPVAVVPVQDVGMAPAQAGMDKEAVNAEISAQLAAMKAKEEEERLRSKWYAAALVGFADYPNAKNIKGEYAAGFAFGKTFKDAMAFEGSFLYSKYNVEQVYQGGFMANGQYYPAITAMDQYNTSALLKYSLFDGSIRPVMGGLVSYTYRSFTDQQFSQYNSEATSDALDFGLMGGLDVYLSEKFSIGLDARYFWNITSKTSEPFQRSIVYRQQQPGSTPVEKISYWTMGLVGKSTF